MEGYSWKFPEDKGYLYDGIKSHMIDSKDSPIQTFVREACQNSNDAGMNRPVLIEFNIFEMEPSQFPDLEGLKKTMRLPRQCAHWLAMTVVVTVARSTL